MLTNASIARTLREIGLLLNHDINPDDLKQVEINQRNYSIDELPEFKRDLVEAGHQSRVIFLEYGLSEHDFNHFLSGQSNPVVAFLQDALGISPILLLRAKSGSQPSDWMIRQTPMELSRLRPFTEMTKMKLSASPRLPMTAR